MAPHDADDDPDDDATSERAWIEALRMETLREVVPSVAHELGAPGHVLALNLPFLREVWADALARLRTLDDVRLAGAPLSEVEGEMAELLAELPAGNARVRQGMDRLRAYTGPLGERAGTADAAAALDAALELLAPRVRNSIGDLAVETAAELPPAGVEERRLELLVVRFLLLACDLRPGPLDDAVLTLGAASGAPFLELSARFESAPEERLAALRELAERLGGHLRSTPGAPRARLRLELPAARQAL